MTVSSISTNTIRSAGLDVSLPVRKKSTRPARSCKDWSQAVCSARTWPNVNLRRNCPNVDGAYTLPASRFIPPEPVTVHIVNTVGTGEHPGDQGHDLPARVRALVRGDMDAIGDRCRQARVLGQFHQGNEPGVGDQVLIVERYGQAGGSVVE